MLSMQPPPSSAVCWEANALDRLEDQHCPTRLPSRERQDLCRNVRASAKKVWHRTKQLCRRIDVSWSFFFLLLLVVIGAITTAVTQTLITRSLLEALHAFHSTRVASVLHELSNVNERARYLATSYLSLHLQHAPVLNSEATIRFLAATLGTFTDTRFDRMFMYSLQTLEGVGCMKVKNENNDTTTLGGYVSENHIVQRTYRVDNKTFQFVQPLQNLGDWPLARQNLSITTPALYGNVPVLLRAEAYYNGSLEYIDPKLFWQNAIPIPHLQFYYLPVGVVARGRPLQPGQYADDFLIVSVDGSKFLTPYGNYSDGFSAAAFVKVSLTEKHPRLYSNNWGQQSVINDSVLAPMPDTGSAYVNTQTVTDPLMKAALKYVHFKSMQTAGYNHSVDFEFRGAYATVTATTYPFKGGLVIPLVMVSAQSYVTKPYLLIMRICNGVTAVAIILFTALFWWFVHNEYSQPLERMTELLVESVRTGKRRCLRRTLHTYIQLKESVELIAAFDDCMRRLREIDTYIPYDIRQRYLRRHGNNSTTDISLQGSLVSSQTATKQTRRHDSLHQHHLTIVWTSVKRKPLHKDVEKQPIDIVVPTGGIGNTKGRRGQHLAAVVERAAHAGSVANSGPFASAAALEAFATAVHDLAARHRGVVRNLTPDGCAVHFAAGVRAHLRKPMAPRTTEAAASASATPAVCGAGPAYDAEALRAHIDADARDALAFALALQQWVDAACGADAAGMPDVRSLVDTGVFTCGAYRAPGSEQTLSVALGRDAQREVGGVPAALGVRVAMTEETAVRVRPGRCAATEPGVRQLPVEALRTGRAGLDGNAVILYEVLPGAAAGDAAWLRYSLCCFDGFECMVRGDYAGALRAYKGVAEISDLEPGLLPASLRREAASSAVTGGAVSVQVQRLMRECERRVAAHVTTRYYRERRSPYGIDTVLRALPLQQRVGEDKPAARRAMSRARSQASSPSKSVLSDALRVRQCAETVRHVIIVRTITGDIPCVLGNNPQRLVDCTGTWWRISNLPMERNPRERWSAHWIALDSAGSMCIASILPFRELQPIVTKAIAGAPRGPMCDCLRSAVPVHDARPKQRRAIEQLFVGRRRLEHPNLLSFSAYSLSVEGGVVLMKNFAPGGTLRDVASRFSSIKTRTLGRFALCILSALACLHENGCVHGAVSLDNAMVGGDGQCRLRGYFVDYALAQATFLLPCTCYVSPAMAAGHAPTPACDMFCYGLLILEALSGKKPWVWAPVEDPEEHGTEEELAALIAAGGPAFCEAVVSGRVVAAIGRLTSSSVLGAIGVNHASDIRRCLSQDPVQRPTATCMLVVAQQCFAE